MAAKLKKRALAEFEQTVAIKEEEPEAFTPSTGPSGATKRLKLTLGRTAGAQLHESRALVVE